MYVLMVPPDAVNLADVKAIAAAYDVDVQPNRFVPPGQMYLGDLWEPDFSDGLPGLFGPFQ